MIRTMDDRPSQETRGNESRQTSRGDVVVVLFFLRAFESFQKHMCLQPYGTIDDHRSTSEKTGLLKDQELILQVLLKNPTIFTCGSEKPGYPP